MANISEANKAIKEITKISNIATSVRKLTGKNMGRLLRDFGSVPELNDALYLMSGLAGTMPKQVDQNESTAIGANMLAVGHCGQYYEFNGNDTKLVMDIPNSGKTLKKRFDNAEVVTIGFYINNKESAAAQTVMMGVSSVPFKISILADNTVEVGCFACKNGTLYGTATAILGEVPADEWSINVIQLDFANMRFRHYINGSLSVTNWPTEWNDTSATWTLSCNVDQDLWFGAHTNSTEYLNADCAGFLALPALCTPDQVDSYFSDFEPVPCGEGIFFLFDECNPTSSKSGEWAITDSTETIDGVMTSTDTSGLIFKNGREASGIYQRMIDAEGFINFRNQAGYLELPKSPAVGSGQNFSLATWFRYVDPAEDPTHLWTITDDGDNSIRLTIVDAVGGLGQYATISGTTYNSGTPGMDADNWYHVAYTVDLSSYGVLYINGEMADTHHTTGWENFDFESLTYRIGAKSGSVDYRSSVLQTGFAVAKEALTPAGVKALANLTKPRGVDNV